MATFRHHWSWRAVGRFTPSTCCPVWQKPAWKASKNRCARCKVDQELIQRVLDLAVEIQQIPSPTFAEEQRAAFLYERFQGEGLQDVFIDDLGNVMACIPGAGKAKPLVVSAHTDTVFPAETNLTVRRDADHIYGPGIGDNSLGVAGLFGLRWALQALDVTLPGDLWLVANVGEEGLGNLRGMRTVADRFGTNVLAYLVLEGMLLGFVYHRGLGVRRYLVKVETAGGHSWGDYGAPSAIHELATLLQRLARLRIPRRPRTSLNAGVIRGGVSVNTIAPEAAIELDLRSEDLAQLTKLEKKVQQHVAAANREGVVVTAEMIGERPVGELAVGHPLVQAASAVLNGLGIKPELSIGSTDANVPLSLGYPAVCVGLTHGGNSHTVDEFIHTEALEQGLAQVVALVQRVFALEF